ncbi:hypothetical protein Ahy_A07g032076 isoform A [Arachis hypogaea]|uniref:Peptidase A1 domain-containing protein n=1 Tax=Arachis hypogaea TaxID=3818 RepID=A0A445C616_ARAHY|nr:hypothetical protein Ahy_A07g032076 isoform A [Arachis hypogaea]
MASSTPLLLQTLTISLIISITLLQFQTSNQQPLLLLPLKQQTQQPSSNSRKLSFQHNVTLTVTLTVGTPPQNVTMVLDTGSELSWLHCNPVNNDTFNFFNSSLSSSYVPTPCNSSICKTRTQDLPIPVSCDSTTKKLCHVIVSYADSTSNEGTLAADTFSIGATPQPNTLFGCMESGYTTNPNEDSKSTGLLGMNQGSLSFVTQLKNEFLNQTKGKSMLKVVEDPNFVFQGAMDLCYSVVGGGGGVAAEVPAVTMVFSGAEMRVSGERLLYKVNESMYCFTFGNSDMLGIEAYVIGHHHQQNVWMEFDLVNARVGFADTKCDLASQRLSLAS